MIGQRCEVCTRCGETLPVDEIHSCTPPENDVRCGFVPPTPGHGPCTREVRHAGPCAHPRTESNPPPKPNAQRPVWELVIEDMQRRDHVGRERYGTPLQPFNGRDALVDAYEEALDKAVYLKQAIIEREAVREILNPRVETFTEAARSSGMSREAIAQFRGMDGRDVVAMGAEIDILLDRLAAIRRIIG